MFKLLTFLTGALFGAVLVVGLQGRADESSWRLEGAFGQCRYSPSPDGTWYQRDQPHSNDYKTNGCFQPRLGYRLKPLLNPSWFNVSWVDLGTAHLNAIAWNCTNDDCSTLDKSQGGRPECAQSFNVNCQYKWTSYGGIKGPMFSVSQEIFRLGSFSIEPELGILVYTAKWYAQVNNLDCDDGACPWRVQVMQKSSTYASPVTSLYLRWHATKEVSFFGGTQIYWRTAQHTDITPGINGSAQTWMAGVAIEL